jgi:hypothetical protein
MRMLLCIVFTVMLTGVVHGQDTTNKANKADKANKAIEALDRELKQKSQAYRKAMRQGDEKARQALKEQGDPMILYEKRYIDFAAQHTATEAARKALIWVSQRGSGTGMSAQAMALLLKDYATDPKIHEAFQSVGYHPDAIGFYSTVLEKTADKTVKAFASFFLGRALANRSDYATLDPAELSRAIKILETTKANYQPLLGKRRMNAVETSLYKLKFLAVGQVAPEISGTDGQGTAFKLSEYRGKVVLLIFWGDW